jgi:hypothetical protein
MVKKYVPLFFLWAFSCFAQDSAVVKEPLPVGLDLYMSQSLGAAAPFKDKQAPYVATSLYLYPYYKTKPFWGERRIKTFFELYSNYEWLGQGETFISKPGEKFSWGDIKFRTELSNGLKFTDIGLTINPVFEIEVPVSLNSRKANRIMGIGGYLNTLWSKWGLFINYKPVAIGYVHTENYKSGDCDSTSTDDDRLGGNRCKIAGRQTMLTLKNGVFVGYSNLGHSVTAGMRVNHHFLRKAGQGEKPSSSNADVMEAVVASLEYGYSFSLDTPLSLMAGVFSSQDAYAAKDGFRMPFFNFTEPSKNETEFYLAMSLSI